MRGGGAGPAGCGCSWDQLGHGAPLHAFETLQCGNLVGSVHWHFGTMCAVPYGPVSSAKHRTLCQLMLPLYDTLYVLPYLCCTRHNNFALQGHRCQTYAGPCMLRTQAGVTGDCSYTRYVSDNLGRMPAARTGDQKQPQPQTYRKVCAAHSLHRLGRRHSLSDNRLGVHERGAAVRNGRRLGAGVVKPCPRTQGLTLYHRRRGMQPPSRDQ